MLDQHSRLFEVAVGDGSVQVFVRDQVGLNIGVEGMSPKVGVSVAVEEDATHALASSVSGAQDDWVLGDDLGEVDGSLTQAGGQTSELEEVLVDQLGDADSVSVGLVEGLLEAAE